MAESDKKTQIQRGGRKDETQEECLEATVALKTEGKPLVLLQVKCRSVYNKILDFWNFTDTYKPDVICTESWLSEEFSIA
jgi:hypothetical protein